MDGINDHPSHRIRELEAALKLHEAEREQTLTTFRGAAKVREAQMAKVTAERDEAVELLVRADREHDEHEWQDQLNAWLARVGANS